MDHAMIRPLRYRGQTRRRTALREYPESGFALERAIEGDNLSSFARRGPLTNQVVGKVALAIAVCRHSPRRDPLVREHNELSAEERFESVGDPGSRLLVPSGQYPHQLAQHDISNEERLLIATSADEQPLDGARLRRVVLHDQLDDQIRVESDHASGSSRLAGF